MPGSIEKRGENSYRLIVSEGNGPGGKRKKYTKTIKVDGKTEAEKKRKVEKELVKFIAEVETNGFVEPSKITFKNFINKWLEEYAKKNLAPKTLFRYEEMLYSRIIPALGHIKLDKLKPINLVEFYNMLQEDGIRLDKKYTSKENFNEVIEKYQLTLTDIKEKADISQRTIENIELHKNISSTIANKICNSIGINTNILFDEDCKPGGLSAHTITHHHRLIHDILETAVKWQLLSSNPADKVDPPKNKEKRSRFL